MYNPRVTSLRELLGNSMFSMGFYQGAPLEKGMATHSSILAWSTPMGRGGWPATVRGVAKSQTQLRD